MVTAACPFCGASESHLSNGAESYWVACRGCGAEGPPAATQEVAVQQWNTRPSCAKCAAYECREREYYAVMGALAELLEAEAGQAANAMLNGALAELDSAFTAATSGEYMEMPQLRRLMDESGLYGEGSE